MSSFWALDSNKRCTDWLPIFCCKWRIELVLLLCLTDFLSEFDESFLPTGAPRATCFFGSSSSAWRWNRRPSALVWIGSCSSLTCRRTNPSSAFSIVARCSRWMTARATWPASCSYLSPGWASVSLGRAPLICCTTWVSSWAKSFRSLELPGLYSPCRKKMSWPVVKARAFSVRLRLSASASVCACTWLKS